MSKLFTFAGTCTENGATVYKFANNANRAKALERFGCTDVVLVELPKPMCKEEAVCFLEMTKGITADKAPRVAKTATAEKPAKAKVEKAVKAPAVVKRVGDAPRKGQSPEEFAMAWFAAKEAKYEAMKKAGKAV